MTRSSQTRQRKMRGMTEMSRLRWHLGTALVALPGIALMGVAWGWV